MGYWETNVPPLLGHVIFPEPEGQTRLSHQTILTIRAGSNGGAEDPCSAEQNPGAPRRDGSQAATIGDQPRSP